MNLIRLFSLLGTLILASPVGAQDNKQVDGASANYMLPFCKAWLMWVDEHKIPDTRLSGLCPGTVGALMWASSELKGTYATCIPSSVPNIQGVRVVVRFLEDNPQWLDRDFRVLAIAAFKLAWPCANN
jgi:hypothetical protein